LDAAELDRVLLSGGASLASVAGSRVSSGSGATKRIVDEDWAVGFSPGSFAGAVCTAKGSGLSVFRMPLVLIGASLFER
jgi:hypothetical protein